MASKRFAEVGNNCKRGKFLQMLGGFAGIGYIILTAGLGFLFHALKKSVYKRSE